MPKPADPLTRKSLRQALKSWDNSQKLGAHPLAQLKAVQARRLAAGYGDTPAGHGVALRDMLHSALQQLKPTGSVDLADRHWRPYTILSSQYLEGRSPDYVVEQLNIARSTYDHEQAEALEALASVLREQEALSAPAPASASASTFQRPYLAPQPTPLVGREVLREQVATQLSTQRLAVLTGLPGAGKTALAAQLAHDLLDQFSDGVLWVSLGRTPDLFGALGLWAVALGLPLDEVAKLSRLEDRARLIHATLGLRSLLLVIDDAWTMEDALAFKIGGPRCAYVLTTRLPRLASEFAGDPSAIFPVPELGEPDALILLARYGLTATDAAHRPEAAALSRAVGGLPLALTIVGRYLQKEARLGQSRRLESALARLERIGETLALTEPRSPLEAQPDMPLSVLAVIAITDDALDPAARLALRALSVFPPKPNSFDEPAALAITGATAAQLDTLSDYGLLETLPPGRYTLHPTVAQYARLSLDSNAEYQTRLAHHFVARMADLAADSTALESDLNNFLATLNAAQAQALPTDLIRGANALYLLMESRGSQMLLEPYLREAVTAARALKDEAALATSLGNLARLLQHHGDYAQAEGFFTESLALARAQGAADQMSAMLSGLGVLAYSQGRHTQTAEYYAEALTLARQHQLQDRLSGLLTNNGALLLSQGDAAGAESNFQEGLTLARALGNRSRVGALLINLGVAAARRGEHDRAEACFQESLELARGAKNREQLVFLLTNLGTLASERHDAAQAEAHFREALTLARDIEDRARVSHLLTNLGALAGGRQDLAMAETYLAEALSLARALGHREMLVLALVNWGDLEKDRQHLPQALSHYQEAQALANQMGHQRYSQLLQQKLSALTQPSTSL